MAGLCGSDGKDKNASAWKLGLCCERILGHVDFGWDPKSVFSEDNSAKVGLGSDTEVISF